MIMLKKLVNNNVKEVELLFLLPIKFFLGDNALFYSFDLENKIKTVRVILLLPNKASSFQYDQLIIFSYSYNLVAFTIIG